MVEVQTMHGAYARIHSGLNVDLPVTCRIGMQDGRVIAGGGLAFGGGRTWLWFFVEPGAKHIAAQALKECRMLLRKAAQLGATEVYTPRDVQYPSSERLCKMAGFEKTDEVLDGQEIWVWRL
jgi:hypothetical protein